MIPFKIELSDGTEVEVMFRESATIKTLLKTIDIYQKRHDELKADMKKRVKRRNKKTKK